MVQQIVLRGIVLGATPIGEFDKRLVILTEKRGKITAFSRGCRRQNSTMIGATEVGVFGDFTFVEGRSAYTLIGADVKKYHMELRDNITSACVSFYCLEFASYYGRENIESYQMVQLLVATMAALCKNQMPPALIRRVFELKMLYINGEYPQVYQCSVCGKSEDLTGFSYERFSVVCRHCKSHGGNSIEILPSTLYTLQYIISTNIEKLYTFVVKDEVMQQLNLVIGRCVRKISGQKFKSEEMMDLMLTS